VPPLDLGAAALQTKPKKKRRKKRREKSKALQDADEAVVAADKVVKSTHKVWKALDSEFKSMKSACIRKKAQLKRQLQRQIDALDDELEQKSIAVNKAKDEWRAARNDKRVRVETKKQVMTQERALKRCKTDDGVECVGFVTLEQRLIKGANNAIDLTTSS
tara:strand:- start:557 stop:1039 length:483 start_codon:yes stop_codon:yes gene_type:complete